MPSAPDPRVPIDAPDDEPGVARDAETLTEVIEDFAARGYVHSFQVVATAGGGPPRVRCLHCRNENAPTAMPIDAAMRLEGASDPDDMMIVVASVCPVCGSRGTLTLGYGPTASSEDDDVLSALPLEPHHFEAS